MPKESPVKTLIGAAVLALLAVLAASCADPESSTEGTRVVAIYPSGDRLPANQLKLYVEFSAPMTPTAPYDRIRLVDEASGRPVDAAFHAMRDGLWDPSGRRLTLLFDPGRLKRGLANHEALGLPLEAGRSYRLEISGTWPDAWGRPLAGDAVKRFEAASADRTRPSTAGWLITAPRADTRDPIRLDFDEPLDAAILSWAFRLFDPDGSRVALETRVGPREESCELRAETPWRAGRYQIEVDPRLEDLAGNNFQRLFDTDLTNHPRSESPTRLGLEIRERRST